MVTPHQQLHEADVFVQGLDGPHFLLREAKIKYLEVVLDPLGAEALGDHGDSSLDVEAQSHLSRTLVVLFPNRHKQLVFQHGRTFHIHPGCVSGGANRAVANDHNVFLTTELQKLGLCEIWMAFNLVGHRLVFEAGFVQQQLQLSAVEVGDSQRLHQPCVFARLQSLPRCTEVCVMVDVVSILVFWIEPISRLKCKRNLSICINTSI